MLINPLFLLLAVWLTPAVAFSQELLTPAEKNDFKQVTSHTELTEFIRQADLQSDLVRVEKTGTSVQGRPVNALLFSTAEFGMDPGKIRVLIFAQQHGNEQSGKEGALLLIRELLKAENRFLFNHIDLALIPQLNPDGSEVNKRRNANDADLNRNHLLLTEPETMALHHFFNRYLFEVTLDVHEYAPYGNDWLSVGYRKNSEVTMGTTTNLNIPESIRAYSRDKVLPYLFRFLENRRFSAFTYCPGDPPGLGYIRHSTFDINDGRQSFGILNTLSLIQEGMNGTDNYTENLAARAAGQMAGMLGLLEFVYENKDQILKMIRKERMRLESGEATPVVSVQSDHTGNGTTLRLPVRSYKTGRDSIVQIGDYRPVVRSLKDVKKPRAYLVPGHLHEILAWAQRQQAEITEYKPAATDQILEYFIAKTDSIDFEGDLVAMPLVEIREMKSDELQNNYFMIPTAQLRGNLIVLGLEPESMIGLATYNKFKYLLKPGEAYPILRIE